MVCLARGMHAVRPDPCQVVARVCGVCCQLFSVTHDPIPPELDPLSSATLSREREE